MIVGDDLLTIIRAAARNDQRAWERLVAEFTPTIRAVARRHRLASFDQDDVVQRTFMALFRHIEQIQEPSRIGAWLATTARRESLRVIHQAAREIPSEDLDRQPPEIIHDEHLPLEDERPAAVRLAMASMPPRQRALISALSVEPALSYEQVSEKLSMPVGSIGPSRQRALSRLRKDPRVLQLLDEYAHPHRPTRPVRPDIDLI